MRIAKISIHNLNSLVGKWEIDLDHPDIRTNGIFAICGPTGAGKTTILDAMALALYGRTPRLDNISQSENEVMSQSTGECASEVVFEAKGQRYKAHWSQQRARKKPEGKLQQARPELSIFNSQTGNWDILATQKTAFDKEVARVTGLTYEEFTRSILLAQGSFAAFLKAKSEVRSAALEKITGTEIYSEISKLVHQRHSKEETLLNQAKAKLEGIELLSDEVRLELETQLRQQKELQSRLHVKTKTLQQACDWRKDVLATQGDITRLNDALAKARQAYQEAIKLKPALDKARTAESIVSYFDAKENARTTLETQQDSLQKLVAELPDFKLKAQKTQNDLNEAVIACSKAQEHCNELEKTLVVVRKIDTDISHADTDFKRETTALKSAQDALADKQKALEQIRLQAAKARQTVTELEPFEKSDHPEQKLALDLANLEVLHEAVKTAINAFAEHKKSCDAVQKRKDEAQKSFDTVSPQVDKAQKAYESAEIKLKEVATEIENTQAGKTSAQWRDNLDTVKDKLQSLKDLSQTVTKLSELDRTISETKKAAQDNRTQYATQQALKDSLEKLLTTLEQSLDRFEEQQKLLSLIEQLQAARKDLKENHPCPLCGALSHPWAEHLPEQSLDRNERLRLKAEMKQTQEKFNAAVKELSQLEGTYESLKKALAGNQKEHDGLAAVRLEILRALDLPEVVDSKVLNELVAEFKGQFNLVKDVLTKLDKLEENRKLLLDARDQTQKAHQKALADVASAREKLAGANATLEGEQKQLQEACDQAKAAGRRIKEMLAEHGIEIPKNSAQLPNVMESLKARVQNLQDKLKTLADARTKVAEFKTKINGINETIATLAREIDEGKTTVKTASEHLVELRKKRVELFGDKLCDTEEKRAKKTLADCTVKRDQVQTASQKAQTDLSAQKGQIQSKESSINALRQDAQNKADLWVQKRVQAGFESDEAWKSARLSPEALTQGERNIEAAKAQTNAVEKSLKDKQMHLAQLNEKPLTDASLESLQTQMTELVQKRSESDQMLGQTREKLDKDAETRMRQANEQAAFDRQKKTLEVWSKLYALIGSADGKKYRQFVQSITFDTLLAYSNEALCMMSDRYCLKRDETDGKEPLGINVIDNYQGGLERSSKNLSGGETFIVSLALSLGLSKMAGRNVKVESLFLDEGFGTLDADALDAALSTLASLNSQGKLIGIISHVGEIRERIGAIIEVKPETGGVSRLSGPGVQSLS